MSAGDGGTRPLPLGGRVPGGARAGGDPGDDPGGAPTERMAAVPPQETAAPPPAPPPASPPRTTGRLRALELVAGLLGGGTLLLGVGLLVAELLSPSLVAGGRGPGWGPVAAHLLVGGAAEGLRALRHRRSVAVRGVVAVVTVVAVVALLVTVWWW